MSNKYILDKNGNPTPCENLFEWAKWFETANRQIRDDKIGNVRVSTVFLGLDHSFGGMTPILFETMIFGGPHDSYQDRYSNLDDAIKGHQLAVDLVSAQ